MHAYPLDNKAPSQGLVLLLDLTLPSLHLYLTSPRSPSGPQMFADVPTVFATLATRLFKLSFWVYKNCCFVEAKR